MLPYKQWESNEKHKPKKQRGKKAASSKWEKINQINLHISELILDSVFKDD